MTFSNDWNFTKKQDPIARQYHPLTSKATCSCGETEITVVDVARSYFKNRKMWEFSKGLNKPKFVGFLVPKTFGFWWSKEEL